MLYNNGDFEVYTTVDGLHGVDLFSIAKDNYNNVWVGGKSPNGFVQIYNIERNNINIFDYGLTEITEFWVGDSIAFAAFIDGQDLGLIKWVYSDGEWSYRDIYRNFPIELGSINGLKVMKNSVFLATNNGLFTAYISSNLKDPNNWSIAFNDVNCLVNTLCEVDSGIAFNQNNSVYRIFHNNTNFQYEQLDFQTPVDFNEMIFDESGYLWGINGRSTYSQKSNFAPISTKSNLSTIISNNIGSIIIGSELGLNIIDKDNFELTRYHLVYIHHYNE